MARPAKSMGEAQRVAKFDTSSFAFNDAIA